MRSGVGVFVCVALAGALLAPRTLPAADGPEVLPYQVSVNRSAPEDAVLLRGADGTLFARAADLERWHLRPVGTAVSYEGESWYPVSDAPGFKAELDAQTQQARLTFPPQAFAPSLLDANPQRRVQPQLPPGLGGFLNYEFVGTRTTYDSAPSSSNLGGLFEAGAFDAWGSVTSQWLGRNLTDEPVPVGATDSDRALVRLDSALVRDFPDDMEQLRFGDGAGASGLWGRPVRYGGVRWTRNFGTQPGYVTLPQPALGGETALPSVLDVYVDGLRRQSLEVPPGEFMIENLPVLTGGGEVEVVVRDLLGRETRISDSYFTGAQMLREGLADFSWEAGQLRRNFGRDSFDYGDFFASTTQRYGFSDTLTGEGRLEVGENLQALGAGGTLAVVPLGVFSNAVAVSHSDLTGSGALDVFTFQHAQRRGLSFGARAALASPRFTQLGLAPGATLARRTLGGNAGLALGPYGRAGVGYISQQFADPQSDTEAFTGTYSLGYRQATVSLIGIQRTLPRSDLTVALTFSMPFGARDYASAGYRQQQPEDSASSGQTFARVQRNLPQDEGWGYRALVSRTSDDTDTVESGEVGAAINARYGSYGAEAAFFDTSSTYRATVSGGVGTLAGHTFASRKIPSSFAVIETGVEDLELLVNNRPAGRADAQGVAVLPYLQPYQENTIRIETADLPLDVELPATEVKTAPYYRSGVLVPLRVRKTRSAVVAMTQDDGSVVPAGARAILGDQEFPVGKGGRAFVTGLAAQDNSLLVRWNGHRCTVHFDLPADAGVQPVLGPLACAPVSAP